MRSARALPTGSDAEALFNTHGAWLLGSLRHRYGADLAEDLLQETYLKILGQRSPVEVLKPKAFLLRVARNLFVSHYRRSRIRAESDLSNQHTQPTSHAPSQVAALVLEDIVLGLPLPLRDVFLLSRFGGMSNQQIADHLGIRVKTVEWRMTKALAHCAAQFRKDP